MKTHVAQMIRESEAKFRRLLQSRPIPFDKALRSALPVEHGVYRIFLTNDPNSTLRAGATKRGKGNLRQRVYQNHLMGDQKGNIRAQLVRNRACADLNEAKLFLRTQCRVQIDVIKDDVERRWAEYFMLSILRPEYCD